MFWNKKKQYDEELETLLHQTQLAPCIEEALLFLERISSGELFFSGDERIEKIEKEYRLVLDKDEDIMQRNMRFRLFTKDWKETIHIKKTRWKYQFLLRLPIEKENYFQTIDITHTKTYDRFKIEIHSIFRSSGDPKYKREQTLRILEKDKHRNRLRNLLK